MDDIERWIISGRDETLSEFLDREAAENNGRIEPTISVPLDWRKALAPSDLREAERLRLAQIKGNTLCAACNVRADQHLDVAHNFVDPR